MDVFSYVHIRMLLLGIALLQLNVITLCSSCCSLLVAHLVKNDDFFECSQKLCADLLFFCLSSILVVIIMVAGL